MNGKMSMMRITKWLLIILSLSGCAAAINYNYDLLFGLSNPDNRLMAAKPTPQELSHYQNVIKPVIDNRCVVCHGCYDAPCQLKLESIKGLERGASKVKVYNGARLKTAKISNFVENIDDVNHWRNLNFFPILNERSQTPEANSQASVFYQMLALKRQHPLPDDDFLDDSFDLSLDREQQCPSIEEFAQYQEDYPLAGMPYGLPAVSDKEHQQLTNWLEQGGKMQQVTQLTADEQSMVALWEKALNGDDLKTQLVSRYLYEHLYLADLFFVKGSNRFFNLVRSTTPPGEAHDIITTRRPYDNPNVDRVYYRLTYNHRTIVDKRHMPYRFDKRKLARIQSLFINQEYSVDSFPSYEIVSASNPFKTFGQLPVKSRYQFLLDEAQFTIMNFIKGPVCRGQIALNVIRDHFWVYFTNPENIDLFHTDKFLATQKEHLQLPAATSTNNLSILDWRKYVKDQKEYIQATHNYLASLHTVQADLDLDLLWSGDTNPNASLTIFRHFDSASVVKGTIGAPPKTSWVINYPLMERIHYLLVAGYDVYGDVSHQLKTRLYMDFLRMEGESNFVTFLPKDLREPTFTSWYQGIDGAEKDYSYANNSVPLPETNILFKSSQPLLELYQKINQYLGDASINEYDVTSYDNYYAQLQKINNFKGESLQVLPQSSLINIIDSNGNDQIYTLLNNSSHSNVAQLFSEDDRRLPLEDTLLIVKGIIGSYPNAFYQVQEQQLDEFTEELIALEDADDYEDLRDKFAIYRTNKNFWDFSDRLHAWYKKHQPNDYGLLDYNRLENR